MAKTKMLCPFSHEICDECPVYRGRHYYLSSCKQYHGYIDEPEDKANAGGLQRSVDLQAFKQWVAPWTREHSPEIRPDIKLKVIDMESGEERDCELAEAKSWDWSDPASMKIIDGVQVTDWDQLVELLSYKVRQGDREVKLYEAPHFMLLGGG